MRRPRGRRRSERGSATLFLAWVTFAVVLLVGYVVESAGASGEKQRLAAVAAQAARAGGQELTPGLAVRGDGIKAAPAAAATSARAFLHTQRVQGAVTVRGNTLTVEANGSYRTRLLSVIGISDIPVKAQAQARLVRSLNGVES